MSFANYDALKSAIIGWLDNVDGDARVDDFLALVHVRLNRAIRSDEMTVMATYDTEAGEPWLPKPQNYHGMRRLKLNNAHGEDPQPLTFTTLTYMDSQPVLNRSGLPTHYAVIADRIRLGPVPNAVWTAEVAYYQKVPVLSPTVTTNVFLEEVSDLLLYGALVEAQAYVKDPDRLELWKSLYAEGLSEYTRDSAESTFPDGDLAIQVS